MIRLGISWCVNSNVTVWTPAGLCSLSKRARRWRLFLGMRLTSAPLIFKRPPAADLLYRLEHLPHGVFENPAIIHLCSNSLTDPKIADVTLAMTTMAKRAGCLVSVDANLRNNL